MEETKTKNELIGEKMPLVLEIANKYGNKEEYKNIFLYLFLWKQGKML